MATDHDSAFSLFNNIQDESRFVHQAMYRLGFLCEFGDLTTDQQRVTLAMAEFLKRTRGQCETWES